MSSMSAQNYDSHRPRTIAELAAVAQQNIWDPSRPLKHWLRTAEKSRKTGGHYVETRDYESAFIEFARAATIVLERLPSHSEYNTLLNADQRANLVMNGQDILDHLSRLKPLLVERYENWRAKYGDGGESSSAMSREEIVRRKREEQQRAQEDERLTHARESAQMEEEWRRDEQARREAEELDRRVKDETAWARHRESQSRESSEARRAVEAREAAEQERASRMRRDDEPWRQHSDEEDRMRRRLDERRRHEQDGILRRQQEAEATARAVRREVANSSGSSVAMPVATPQPSRPPSQNRQYNDTLDRNVSWNQGHGNGSSRQLAPGLMYPPPMTTTSPAPPDLGVIRYPTLMSQHQLKQGYVPSLQSMFSHPSEEPPLSSSLLLDTKPSGALYTNLLPKPSNPPMSHTPSMPNPSMPVPDPHQHSYNSRPGSQRRPSPSSGRPLPTPVVPPPPVPPPPSASRITRGASTDSEVKELKPVRLPHECLNRFLSIAKINTAKNRETCGLLLGKDKGNKFIVTTLLIPKQHSTSDTCTMDEEELVMQFTEERHLITLGWIHTHPTQSCFMSSVDLHTHSGFQRMLPESFAVVCAPTSTPAFGIFRLTDPVGLTTILECRAKEAFHPHPEVPIYTDCDNCHVQMRDISLEIVDLRDS